MRFTLSPSFDLQKTYYPVQGLEISEKLWEKGVGLHVGVDVLR